MDLIEQVGTRYLEGKAYAAPQQLENYAKKQFLGSEKDKKKGKPRKGSASTAGEEEEEDREREEKASRKGASEHGSVPSGESEKDLEIARLRGELEESRRGGGAAHSPKERRASHGAASAKPEQEPSHTTTRKLRKTPSTRAFEGKGIKVVGGALVTDAASRRHREKRPEHGATRGLGRTVDGKAIGITGGALVAEKGSKARSKSEHASREPIIVEAAPRPRRRRRTIEDEEDSDEKDSNEEENESAHGSAAHSILSRRCRRRSPEEHEEAKSEHGSIAHSRASNRRRSFGEKSEHGSIAPSRISTRSRRRSIDEESQVGSIAPSRASTRRRSFAEKSEVGSSIAAPPSHRKSILASRGRRPSTESAVGSVIAPRAQVDAIRRRQLSRGRGLADAEIDTPAPETPSLRALSRRRREMKTRHERSFEDGEGEEVHLPERRKSMMHERVGEGSVIDVLEARSVPFRPHREGGSGGRETRGREIGIVEVMEAQDRRGPVARKIDVGGRNGGMGKGKSEVELMRREGGRTVYRVR